MEGPTHHFLENEGLDPADCAHVIVATCVCASEVLATCHREERLINIAHESPHIHTVHTLYVTLSGKRYISAQKFKIVLAVLGERAKRKEYDGANPASVAHSCDAL